MRIGVVRRRMREPEMSDPFFIELLAEARPGAVCAADFKVAWDDSAIPLPVNPNARQMIVDSGGIMMVIGERIGDHPDAQSEE